MALKLISSCKLNFDERVVVHRVVSGPPREENITKSPIFLELAGFTQTGEEHFFESMFKTCFEKVPKIFSDKVGKDVEHPQNT